MTESKANQSVPITSRPTSPAQAIAELCPRLQQVVRVERVVLDQAQGRVLAEPIVADRDSPACHVSAMDGYALRQSDLQAGRIRVAGEVQMGCRPPELPVGQALRIFTGGAVPDGAQVVVPREKCIEIREFITLQVPVGEIAPGQNIRFRSENAALGTVVVESRRVIDSPTAAALAAFGYPMPSVHRRVRVAVIVTGDELPSEGKDLQPWQLRDANGPSLGAILHSIPWVQPLPSTHAADALRSVQEALEIALANADAVLLTGGVSAGDHDHVPDAVRSMGATVVFHKLPIRPGKWILGAVGAKCQLILALPGNPVSVQVTARRFALPALARQAGIARPIEADAIVSVVPGATETGNLWCYRLVRRCNADRVELVENRGSGDVVAAARSDGFIEMSPGQSGSGPFPFYRWGL